MHEQTYLITELFGTGITLNIPSAITTIITCILTFIIVKYLTSRIKLRPDSKRQNMAEMIAFIIKDSAISNVNWTKYGKSLWGLGLSLASLIAVANIIGVIVEVTCGNVMYLNSVTADSTFTFTMAGMMILFTHYYGFKHKGSKHYFRTYVSGGAFLSPFKVLEEFVNILTLSLRLYGNIYAGEILLGLLSTLTLSGIVYGVLGMVGLITWKAFSLFVGFIQAYIFTIMVFVYLSHKVEDEH